MKIISLRDSEMRPLVSQPLTANAVDARDVERINDINTPIWLS